MEEKKIRPQDKWNEKAGLISKSYKLKRDLVEEFARVCGDAKVSQAGQLTKMMKIFVSKKEVEEEYIASKEPLVLSVSKIRTAISQLKNIQREIADETEGDMIGEVIDILLEAEDQGRSAIIQMYETYNKIYQNVQD